METFGEYLKAQREKKGIRLEEIASITKIHLHSLELLETDDWGHLPPEPFLRGFILAYAKYVGLDPKETIGKYHESLGQNPPPASEVPKTSPAMRANNESPSDVIQNTRQLPWNKIFAGVGVFAVVVLIGVFIYVGKKSSEPREIAEAPAADPVPAAITAPVPDEAAAGGLTPPNPPPQESAPSEKVVMVPAPMGEVPAAAPEVSKPVAVTAEAATKPVERTTANEPTQPQGEFKHELVVEGQERTWMKVVIDDEKPVEFFLPKGEKTTYQAKNKIKVVLGNSSGAKILHNGEVTKGKKFQGTIRYYVFPENARFPQDAGTRKVAAAKPEGEEGASVEAAPADGEAKPE